MDIRKAAHVAAAFLLKAPRHQLPKLKLMKLMYLAERLSLAERGFPMIYDRLACLPKGPVLQGTLDLTEDRPEAPDRREWSECVAPLERHHGVRLARQGLTENDLRALSRRDVEIIEAVWEEFGGWDSKDLVGYTHDLPEYEEKRRGEPKDLTYRTVLTRGLSLSDDIAKELEDDILFHQSVALHGYSAAV